MSEKTTKPNTSKNKSKSEKTKSGKRPISSKHISLPGGKELKMTFVRWVMLLTFAIILIVVLVTMPNRLIRNHIKSLESKDEIVEYCTEKGLNCSFTTMSDYDIEGFKVSRVAFIGDDFYEATEVAEPTSETVESNTGESESSEASGDVKSTKNVYITIQNGATLEVEE